jgi:hypothetical protein
VWKAIYRVRYTTTSSQKEREWCSRKMPRRTLSRSLSRPYWEEINRQEGEEVVVPIAVWENCTSPDLTHVTDSGSPAGVLQTGASAADASTGGAESLCSNVRRKK